MNDKINESFSAFIDGEASEVDIQRMLKALDNDPTMLEEWHRLSRAQAMMAGDVLVDVAIQSESATQPEPRAKPSSPWLLRLGQGAVAAAVALVVVVATYWPESSEVPLEVAVETDLHASQAHFEVQQRFNSYLRQHAEAASYGSGHAVVPYELYWETNE